MRNQSSVHRIFGALLYDRVTTELLLRTSKHETSAELMLVHRLRRWPNIIPGLGKRLVFGGI